MKGIKLCANNLIYDPNELVYQAICYRFSIHISLMCASNKFHDIFIPMLSCPMECRLKQNKTNKNTHAD